jgi:integrase
MPRPKGSTKTPSYCHHKGSGQAYVTLNNRPIYLGAYGSPESRQKYDRVVGEFLAAGRTTPADVKQQDTPSGRTVATIVLAFWTHAQSYYKLPDGSPSSELDAFKMALRPLRKLYGDTPAAEFGPVKLKTMQEHMVGLGWARKTINRQSLRIRHVFKWAAGNELIPASVYHGLLTVPGLRAGRTKARETAPVTPVAESAIEAIRPYLSTTIANMIDLQLLTGMRPGELVIMRTCDIDRSKPVWIYRPMKHKTEHHGHKRKVRIGPKAQEILAPLLKLDLQAFIFSPVAAEAERRAEQHEKRKTPMNQGNKPGSNRTRRPKRAPGDRYDVASYRRAIARACEQAFTMPAEYHEPRGKALEAELKLPKAERAKLREERREKRAAWRQLHVWHPHQLRHNAATLWREQYGPEAALTLLGDTTTRMIDVYAEKNQKIADTVMAAIG